MSSVSRRFLSLIKLAGAACVTAVLVSTASAGSASAQSQAGTASLFPTQEQGGALQLVLPSVPVLRGGVLMVPVKVLNAGATAYSATLEVEIDEQVAGASAKNSGVLEQRQLIDYAVPDQLSIASAGTSAVEVSVPLGSVRLPADKLQVQVRGSLGNGTVIRDIRNFTLTAGTTAAPMGSTGRPYLLLLLLPLAAAYFLIRRSGTAAKILPIVVTVICVGSLCTLGVQKAAANISSCISNYGPMVTYICHGGGTMVNLNLLTASDIPPGQPGDISVGAVFNSYPFASTYAVLNDYCEEAKGSRGCSAEKLDYRTSGTTIPCANSDIYLPSGDDAGAKYPVSTLSDGTYSLNGHTSGLDQNNAAGYVSKTITDLPGNVTRYDYNTVFCINSSGPSTPAYGYFYLTDAVSYNGVSLYSQGLNDDWFVLDKGSGAAEAPSKPSIHLFATPTEVPSGSTAATLSANWAFDPTSIVINEVGGDGYVGTFTPNTFRTDSVPVAPSSLPNGSTAKAVHTYVVTATNKYGSSTDSATITVDPPDSISATLKADGRTGTDSILQGQSVVFESLAQTSLIPIRSVDIQLQDASGAFSQEYPAYPPVGTSLPGTGKNVDQSQTTAPFTALGLNTYRLEIIDTSGNVRYSSPVSVQVSAPGSVKPVTTLSVDPQAVQDGDIATFTAAGSDADSVEVQVSPDGGTTWSSYYQISNLVNRSVTDMRTQPQLLSGNPSPFVWKYRTAATNAAGASFSAAVPLTVRAAVVQTPPVTIGVTAPYFCSGD